MTTWPWLVGAIVLDGAAAFAGGLLPDAWLARHRTPLIAFATGTLLTAALIDILPAAIAARGSSALWWAAGGFVAIALGEALFSGHEPGQTSPGSLLVSDALHNIADGMAIAAAFVQSIHLGLGTSIAVIVHEVPEEIADYALLRLSRLGKRNALFWLFVVQCTAAVGAAGTALAARWTDALAGIALAIAAGTFLFIASVDLLPAVLRAPDRRAAIVGLLSGAALIAIQAAA